MDLQPQVVQFAFYLCYTRILQRMRLLLWTLSRPESSCLHPSNMSVVWAMKECSRRRGPTLRLTQSVTPLYHAPRRLPNWPTSTADPICTPLSPLWGWRVAGLVFTCWPEVTGLSLPPFVMSLISVSFLNFNLGKVVLHFFVHLSLWRHKINREAWAFPDYLPLV